MSEIKHTKNGLVQKSLYLSSGYILTISIATGIVGESPCLIMDNRNIYSDDDSRNEEQNRHFVVPLSVEDMLKLKKELSEAIKERNITLKK